ncbi:hypothetical protein CH330_02975 [candidate division WOR-3 bacterium JGI_Cruoil_03_51_56]|uniref:Uncharacterized protein n=1 Tax=candidate division WOR-3 bacterium JGI_Cruoil_03_51_56 TaxID=1973747 RepID=A0A235BW16_UNCW3|nr:MAG: hypothetical protein CH330_02975 [candidate division WOR-3 bacterium JGI_Cruoil_03_51_56]
MRTIKVSKRHLLFALSKRVPGTNHYLDTRTGEVIPVFSFNRNRILVQIKAEPDRYIRLAPPSSRHGYETMKRFVQTVSRPELRSRLEAALKQKKAFQSFRAVLKQEPPELKRWYNFRTEMMVQALREHLNKENIKLELIND